MTRGSKIAANGEICFELKCSLNLLTRRLLVSAIYLTTLNLIFANTRTLVPSGSSNKMLFLLFCKTLLVRLRRHTCSNFHNDTKTLLYLTFVRSHLNMIMLCVRSGVLSQLEIFRKMRVSEKDLSNQIYFELAWMGRIPPQYHGNLTKLGF